MKNKIFIEFTVPHNRVSRRTYTHLLFIYITIYKIRGSREGEKGGIGQRNKGERECKKDLKRVKKKKKKKNALHAPERQT